MARLDPTRCLSWFSNVRAPALVKQWWTPGLRTIRVPENVHKAWEAGGTERNQLIKLFGEAGLDKENVEVYDSNVCGLFSKSYI